MQDGLGALGDDISMSDHPVPTPDDADRRPVVAAEEVAARLLAQAGSHATGREQRHGKRITRLLADPSGSAFVPAFTDKVPRIRDDRRVAQHFRSIVNGRRCPSFLGALDQLAPASGRLRCRRYPN